MSSAIGVSRGIQPGGVLSGSWRRLPRAVLANIEDTDAVPGQALTRAASEAQLKRPDEFEFLRNSAAMISKAHIPVHVEQVCPLERTYPTVGACSDRVLEAKLIEAEISLTINLLEQLKRLQGLARTRSSPGSLADKTPADDRTDSRMPTYMKIEVSTTPPVSPPSTPPLPLTPIPPPAPNPVVPPRTDLRPCALRPPGTRQLMPAVAQVPASASMRRAPSPAVAMQHYTQPATGVKPFVAVAQTPVAYAPRQPQQAKPRLQPTQMMQPTTPLRPAAQEDVLHQAVAGARSALAHAAFNPDRPPLSF